MNDIFIKLHEIIITRQKMYYLFSLWIWK